MEELFDSIVRGFPIGGLLLWRRPVGDSHADLQFGPVHLRATDAAEADYIVDGQQRITALVAALLHPGEPPLGDNYALWVDLVNGTFKVWRERPPRYWIPVHLLGDRRRLMHWAREPGLGDDALSLIDRAFQLEEAIIRYAITVYIVRDAEPAALRLIFSRTNSSGVPLKEEQVFQALFGKEGEERPLSRLAGWLHEQTRFGVMSESWLLRCMKAIGELDPRRSFSEENPPDEDLLTDTRQAMRRAVLFLQNEAHLPHQSVLPYRLPLIVLARFFHLHPEPHPRTRALLTRWVWRGALSGEHGNSSHAAVSTCMADIGEDEHESMQRLLAHVPEKPPLPDPSSTWNGHAAASRISAALQIDHGPLDPSSERPVPRDNILDLLSRKQPGEVFKQAIRGDHGAIAGRVFLPSNARSGCLRSASEEVLRSLCIRDAAAEALHQGNAEAFIALRAVVLREELDRLVRRLALPTRGENERPPLAVIAATGS